MKSVSRFKRYESWYTTAYQDDARKTPLDYTVLQYILVMILGAIGGPVARPQIIVGIVNIAEMRDWKTMAVDATGFCGLLAFWACESINMKPLLTAVIIGITGHMGSARSS